MKNIALILMFNALLIGCASTPKPRARTRPTEVYTPPTPQPIRIDYIGLQQSLGLRRGIENVGYVERAFDTCKAGNGFSHSENCHKEYFVLMHFQLQCRDQEEAPADGSPMDIQPINNRDVTWLLQEKTGSVVTDSDGYGQIRMTYKTSPGTQHIKLSTNGQYLFVTANDLNKIVTPPKWCH